MTRLLLPIRPEEGGISTRKFLLYALAAGVAVALPAVSGASPSSGATEHVYVVSIATGQSRALAVGSDPSMSPDGRLIAYLRDGQIWLMRAADGGAQRQLTTNGGGPPSWSPDGRTLMYTLWNLDPCYPGPATKCAVTDVWTVDVDGYGERKLLERALSPVWSPDGRRVLYRTFAGPAEASMPAGDLRLAAPDGSHIAVIPTGLTYDATRQRAAWSPRARWIAYERQMWSGEHRLLLVRPSGSGRRRLSSGASPAWSPDGRLIAFERKTGVWLIPATGGRPRRVAPSSSCPTWSPGGKRLAFVTAHYPTGGTLWIVNRDGTGRKRVAAADPCFVAFENDFPSPPSWSRDGRRIYYSR